MSLIGNTLKAILALGMVAGVLFGGFFLFNYGSSLFGSLGSSDEGKGQPVIFVIKPGESTTLIAENLKKAKVLDQGGLIDSIDQFKGQLKVRGVEGKIRAGRFELTTGMKMDLLIDTLVNSSGSAGLKFQVIEGKRVEEIAGELSAQNVVSPSRFLELTTKPEGAALFGGMSVFMNAGDAFAGDVPSIGRMALGMVGLLAAVMLQMRPDMGWRLGWLWALAQIPVYAWVEGGNPTAQWLSFPLGYWNALGYLAAAVGHFRDAD